MVDFPLAVGPIMANVDPFRTSKEMSCRISASVPG